MKTNIEEQIKEAIRKDFHKLYVKQFTTDWREQRFLRDIEIGVMSFDNLTNLLTQQREELIKLIKESTPRYIKGGESRTQYYAKGYNDFREDAIRSLSQQEENK